MQKVIVIMKQVGKNLVEKGEGGSMTSEIIDVLIKQCEAGIERHKMNVRVLTEKELVLQNMVI